MEESRMLKLGFIGAGKVGTALATLLNNKGYHVVAVSSRSLSSAENLAKSVDDCKVYNDNQRVADIIWDVEPFVYSFEHKFTQA